LSKLWRGRKDKDKARRYGQAALQLSRQVKDKLTRAVALYNLAMVDAADGQLADAKGALAEAREAFAAFAGVELVMVDQAIGSLDHRDPSTTPGGGGGPDRTPTGGPDRTLSRCRARLRAQGFLTTNSDLPSREPT
jgi:hypothetical protein